MMSSNSHTFFSRHGGTWVDRNNFIDLLLKKVKDGIISVDLAARLVDFERNGYTIIPSGVDLALIENFEKKISRSFLEGSTEVVAQRHGDGKVIQLDGSIDRSSVRIVDAYTAIPEALMLLSCAPIVEFLSAVFEETPLLFQSISFDFGSQQGLHQDTAYVVTEKPMELLACWIALEDVTEGSGELQYLEGSHRIGDFKFGDGRKHWDPVADGSEMHASWFNWILEQSKALGLPLKSFIAKKGDILIWHADLAHGGAPIQVPNATRKSLVGHYCPSSSTPLYMKLFPDSATRISFNGVEFSSYHQRFKISDFLVRQGNACQVQK